MTPRAETLSAQDIPIICQSQIPLVDSRYCKSKNEEVGGLRSLTWYSFDETLKKVFERWTMLILQMNQSARSASVSEGFNSP